MDDMCAACLVDDLSAENFGEQDFDEHLFFELGGDA